jgi:uncharacterized membrane protein YphA (DoxX/SURF4 family)
MKVFIWIIRLVATGIVFQTLYFKFLGTEESIYIFETLGLEPNGRIGSGVIELLASVFILIPRTTIIGALLGFVTMLSAIVSHLFF